MKIPEMKSYHCVVINSHPLLQLIEYFNYCFSFIFPLNILQERYWHKPTYLSLRSSLEAMKCHALQHSVTAIAMPRIGCGLDGLVWDRVREILTDVFKDTDIKISVYTI